MRTVLNSFVTADQTTRRRLFEIFSIIITSTNFRRILYFLIKPWLTFFIFSYLIKSIYFLQETWLRHSTNKRYPRFASETHIDSLSKISFRRLLEMTMYVSFFIFDQKYNKQYDGVAMGSPLGPTLGNIFLRTSA